MFNLKDRLVGISVSTISLVILNWLAILYIAPQSYLDFYSEVGNKFGFRGALWAIFLPLAVPMALRPFQWTIGNPLPFMSDIIVSNPIGDNLFFFVVVGIWSFSAFLGGLSAARGLGTGMRVVRDTSIVVQLIFAVLTSTVGKDIIWPGIDWLIILVATFFVSYTIGGSFILSLFAAVFGGIGGVLGKVSFESLSLKRGGSSSSSSSSKSSDLDDFDFD